MNMTKVQKFVRIWIISCFIFIIIYAIGLAISGIGRNAPEAKAQEQSDPLEVQAAEHLTLLKALRTENQEKTKKEAALKESTDNIELLKKAEAEKQKDLDAAVLAPVVSPKE